MRILLVPAIALLTGCAAPSVSCVSIEDPPFGERLALAKELPNDGPASQKWIELYAAVLEKCRRE